MHSYLCHRLLSTGSTTAALINLLNTITLLLQNHEYVHLIGLDFSKAFDSVRHFTLIQKLSQFPIPSCVHNWLIEYLDTRQHCTKYNSIISTFLQINASFVQGSRIGPIAYVYNASDLHALFPENDLNKYADDTYLIVPSSNSHTVSLELDHISEWAQCNNLMLNTAKSMEMIIHKPGVKLGNLSVPPANGGSHQVLQFENFGRYCHRHPIFRPSHFECCHTVCPNRLCPSHTKVSWAKWSCSLECHSRHPNI